MYFVVGLFDRIDNIMAYILMLIMIWTLSRRWFRIQNDKFHSGSVFLTWIRRAMPFCGKDIYSLSPSELARIREQDRSGKSPMGTPLNLTQGARV